MKYLSFTVRVAVFIVLIYGVDKTPLDVYSLAARFHWNHFEMFLYSGIGFYLSWRIATAVSHWLSKQFWRGYHNRRGLADIERISEWSATDFDRDFEHLHRIYQSSPEDRKQEKALDILAFVEVASKHGFAQQRDGDAYHFVRTEKKDTE
jgi:hypothetical protein